LLAPVPGKPHEQVAMRVDVETTVKRAVAGRSLGDRGLGVAADADAALDPRHEDLVLARFVDPPPEIKQEVARRHKKNSRGLVLADMNHVLLAACRDDQTPADAVIPGRPSG